MSRHLSTRNISSKSMRAFLSNLAHRQTDKRGQKHVPPPLSRQYRVWTCVPDIYQSRRRRRTATYKHYGCPCSRTVWSEASSRAELDTWASYVMMDVISALPRALPHIHHTSLYTSAIIMLIVFSNNDTITVPLCEKTYATKQKT